MSSNPLKALEALGQSLWLDYISKDLIARGGLMRLIKADGLGGMTSNPAIFEKAIVDSHDYDDDIQALAQAGKDAKEIYETLSQRDVQKAADAFRPVYDRTHGRDGFVSLEVNPHLARDTEGTLREARRLWAALDRPNVLIKVPATAEGLPAIRQLVSEGINVNVTLLFGRPRYRQVAEAYIGGIEDRLAQGKDISTIASVASFFLSRIDTKVDPWLEKQIAVGGALLIPAEQALGQVAIASARMAYQDFKQLHGHGRFQRLAARGAGVQRLLWASTGTKNPAYRDVRYLEELIGPDTVNTVPVETLDAFRDHGVPRANLEHNLKAAARILEHLPDFDIDLDHVTQQLEDEGVEKFNQLFDQLMATLADRSIRHPSGKA